MIRESKDTSYYEILDVSMNANHETIRTAYIRAKNAYNRDSLAIYTLFDQDESRRILDQIEEAYNVLSDAEKRKKYDESHGYISSEPGSITSFPRNTAWNGSTVVKTEAGASTASEQSPIARLQSLQSAGDNYTPLRTYKASALYEKNEETEEKLNNPSIVNGAFLKMAREYKNVSQDAIMELVKIKRNYLTALEEDDFKKLPAAVFVRGFVVQYAKALNLDGEKIASCYMSFYKSRSS